MLYERHNFCVITGCSGGGKSTIIDGLRERGFLCVDEAGRQIVREQLRIDGDGTPWQNPAKFRELLLSRYMHLYEQVSERNKPVFFDRAIPDLAGSPGLSMPEYYRSAARIYRYAKKVFIVPPWKEIFQNDDERKHSYEIGIEEYRALLNIYPECGYQLIEVPRRSVAERVRFILERAGAVGEQGAKKTPPGRRRH
jgi:predicted ATPase